LPIYRNRWHHTQELEGLNRDSGDFEYTYNAELMGVPTAGKLTLW